MPKIDFSAILIVLVSFTLVGAFYGFGPVLWYRRSKGKKRAQTGEDRRELLARVQQLLPQASDDNLVFSLYCESRTSGGSSVKVTTHTYYRKVYVVDGGQFWLVPFQSGKGKWEYALGQPIQIPAEAIKHMSYSGKRGKNLKCVFTLELDGQIEELEMMLSPCCVRESKYYPFDLLQEKACENALAAFEQLAQTCCGLSVEDLEKDRIKQQCVGFSVYAIVAGFVGMVFSMTKVPALSLVAFGVAVVLFGLMFAKKNPPKVSLVLVLIEAALAWLLH